MPRPGKLFLALDNNYFDDPVVIELSDAAQLLDLRAMTLMKRLQSDGRLTLRQIDRIAPDSPPESGDLLGELTASGLWSEKSDGSYERRSWFDWNDTAEDIAAMIKGGLKGNHLSWHVRGRKGRPAKPDPTCELCISDGLVSPPDSPTDRPPISHPTQEANRREDLDVDPDLDAYKDSNSCADTSDRDSGLSTALAGALSIDLTEMTPSSRGSFDKAVRDLETVHASPEDILRRVGMFQQRWPNATCTPSALAKHWPQLADLSLGTARDVVAEYFAYGQKMADKSPDQFTDLLAEKTQDPDKIESAWDGRNSRQPADVSVGAS
jgi:hypothetical protein